MKIYNSGVIAELPVHNKKKMGLAK